MKSSSALLLPGLSEEAILRWMVLILSFLIGGFAGVCAVVVAQLLMNFSKKYGRGDTSRFGGIVVVSFFFLSQLWFVGTVGLYEMTPETRAITAAGMLLFLFGVYQEIFGAIALKTVFLVLVLFFSGLLYMNPTLVLHSTGLSWMDAVLASSTLVEFVCTVLMLAYSVFAFNTANGANGLIPLLTIVGVAGLAHSGMGGLGSMLSLVAVGCVIFMLFNVTIGRIYIGAGGTYFLGALIGLAFVNSLNNHQMDFWHLLCLFFYPNANLLFSLVRRLSKGKSFFGDDNSHLHNLLYRKLSTIQIVRNQASTLAGVCIVAVFCGLPLMVGNTEIQVEWLWVYIALWLMYILFWLALASSEIKNDAFVMAGKES